MENNKKNIIPDTEKEKEFNKVYRRYSALILNIAYQYLKDSQLAEEVMQEVMFRYYVHMNDSNLVYLKSWLSTIAKNLCINILKKRKYEVITGEIELVSNYRDTVLTEALDPEEQYLETERQRVISGLCEDIFRKLKETNEKEYCAIEALYREEKAKKDIAKDMDMTEGAFYTMLCRAKAKVRKKYVGQYEGIKELW